MHCVVCALCGVCIVCFIFENSLCGVCFSRCSVFFIFGHHHCKMNPMEKLSAYNIDKFAARAEATEKERQKERQKERPPSLISALALESKCLDSLNQCAMLAEKYSRLHVIDVRRKYRVWSRYCIEATPPQSPRCRAIEEAESQSPPQSPPRDFFVHVRATEDLLCHGALTLPEAQSQQSGASQWLNAPSTAHPDNCRPCWFTAKNKGCHRDGCLFCHQPHDIGDVRHPGGRDRQRVTIRKDSERTRQRRAHIDFLNAHIRVKAEPTSESKQSPAAPEERHRNLPRWPLSEFVLPKSDTKNDRR